MKRSEVLGTIYNILYKNTDESEAHMEDLSNIILDKLENLGMRPPAWNFEMADQWEPENEKE